MEYFPGGSLAERVATRKPCPTGQALDWLEETSAALDAAHAAGIVHRDVKPANLLLDGRGHVFVADFGIASAAGLDSFTRAGTILGTAGYLSPEQAKGERATAASDLYGLAVVAWELLTGHRPFESSSPTAEAAAHVNAPVPSVHDANPALPPGFDPIFERALAKEPAARHATAAELVGDLRRALHDDGGRHLDRAARSPGSCDTRRSCASARRRWLPAGLLAVLLAAGILTAVLVGRGGGGTPRARTVVRTVTARRRARRCSRRSPLLRRRGRSPGHRGRAARP